VTEANTIELVNCLESCEANWKNVGNRRYNQNFNDKKGSEMVGIIGGNVLVARIHV